MYGADPTSDITQVSLWTAYKVQFEPVTQNPVVPAMLAIQDVIKLAGTAYPSAVPTIIDGVDRRFIIKGLKARRRTGHDSPLAFHQHVYNTHLALTTPPSSCLWSNCSYTPSSTSDHSLRLAQLTLHARIHLPSLTSNSFPSASSDPAPELPPSIFNHVRYHAQVDEHHEASGPGFLACLILRNLTRAAKFALESATSNPTDGSTRASEVAGGGRVSVASDNAAIGRLAEGEQSIFEAFAIAEEGSSMGKKGRILSQVEKVDWEIANSGPSADAGGSPLFLQHSSQYALLSMSYLDRLRFKPLQRLPSDDFAGVTVVKEKLRPLSGRRLLVASDNLLLAASERRASREINEDKAIPSSQVQHKIENQVKQVVQQSQSRLVQYDQKKMSDWQDHFWKRFNGLSNERKRLVTKHLAWALRYHGAFVRHDGMHGEADMVPEFEIGALFPSDPAGQLVSDATHELRKLFLGSALDEEDRDERKKTAVVKWLRQLKLMINECAAKERYSASMLYNVESELETLKLLAKGRSLIHKRNKINPLFDVEQISKRLKSRSPVDAPTDSADEQARRNVERESWRLYD